MKVYLASSFDLKEKVQQTACLLELKGVEITRKWWLKDYKNAFGQILDEDWYDREEVKWVSEENFKAIDQAEAIILVCPDDSPHRFTGANIEVGYALAKGKRVLALGMLARSAMYASVEKHRTIDAVLIALG